MIDGLQPQWIFYELFMNSSWIIHEKFIKFSLRMLWFNRFKMFAFLSLIEFGNVMRHNHDVSAVKWWITSLKLAQICIQKFIQ